MPVTPHSQEASMGPHRYRIIVSGTLGEITREVFEDLSVESHGANTGLTGELDQAGLYGVLGRIQAFGLELVAVSRLDDEKVPSESRCKWRAWHGRCHVFKVC